MGKLSLEVYERGTSTKLGTGPILTVQRAQITRAVDRIGRFSIDIPASERQYALFTAGREVRLYEEDEGEVWRGILDQRRWNINASGVGVLTISGSSLAIELQWESTYMGINIDDLSTSDAIDAILSGTSWTKAVTGAGFVNLTKRIDNMSLWQALAEVAKAENAYIRETNTAREVEIKIATGDSGLVLSNYGIESISPFLAENTIFGLIEGLPEVREEGSAIINRIVPLGLHEDNVIYDLGSSGRSSPYTIQNFVKNRPKIVEVVHVAETGAVSKEIPINCLGTNRVVLLFLSTDYGSPVQDPLPTLDGTVMHRIADAETPTAALWIGFPVRGKSRISLPTQNVGHAGVAVSLRDCQFDPSQISHVDAPSPGTALGSSNTLRDIDIEQHNSAHTTVSRTLTSDDDDLCLDFIFFPGRASDPSVVAGGGQTELADFTAPLPSGNNWMWTSQENGSDGGVTMSASFSSLTDSIHAAVSIKPAITYYIEDSTSVTAYGRRILMIIESGQKFLGASSTQLQNAANTLYDEAVTLLERNKDPPTFYEVNVASLPSDSWLVGDSMRLLYRGTGRDQDGAYVWLDVDATVKVMQRAETWDSDGNRRWRLLLSTLYRFPRTNEEILGENLSKIQAIESTR